MKNILIVKLGAIGDVIMALPLLDELLSEPDLHVDWLVGKAAEPILHCIEDTKLRVISVDERAIFRGSPVSRMRAILSTWKALGFARYHTIYMINGDSRYAILAMFCRGPRRWFRGGKGFRSAVPGRHHSSEYLRMSNGVDDSGMPTPRYPSLTLPRLPTVIETSITSLGNNFVAVSPAGAKNVMREEGLRRWPIGNYRETMVQLRGAGVKVVLVGGPGDGWASKELVGHFDLDLTEQLALGEFLSLLNRASLLITHDSGPLHMGDLVGTPVIGIFGPTSPDEKRPIASENSIFWNGNELSCRPCYDGRTYADCRDPKCLKATTPFMVVSQALRILNQRPS